MKYKPAPEERGQKGSFEMLNEKTVTVKMKRIELCNLLMATTCIASEARTELAAAETTEDRKNVLPGTVKHWEALHDMLKSQLDDFDRKHAGEI